MKTLTFFLTQNLRVYITLICIVCIAHIAFAIEPIATIGQPPPDQYGFLSNQALLRASRTDIQIVHPLSEEIIDTFGIRTGYSDVVFSSKGTHSAILNYSKDTSTTTVNIWDTNARTQISEWEIEERIDITAFSPTQSLLATFIDDKIYLWNWQTGQLVGTMVGERRQLKDCYYVEHQRDNGKSTTEHCTSSTSAHDAVFTADGKHLIVASKRPDIEVWNVETRNLVGHFEGHSGNWVDSLAISPDGIHLASFEEESNLVYLWDVSTRQLLLKEPIGDEGISDLIFSPDSNYLYAADSNVYIFDTKSGQQIDNFGNDFPGLDQMVLSPDGKTLLMQHMNEVWDGGVAVLWDIESKQQLKVYAEYTGGEVRLSPNGQTMVSTDLHFIKIWDVPSRQVRMVIPSRYLFNRGVAISSDSQKIAYCKYPFVEVRDIQTGKVETQFQINSWMLEQTAFSPSGRWLAAVDSWHDLFILDVKNPENIQRIFTKIELESPNFEHIAFNENGEYLAATGRTEKNNNYKYWIMLWRRDGDNFEFQYAWNIPQYSSGSSSSLAFATSEDGSTVLAASEQNDTQIWKILTNKAELITTLSGAQYPIYFSADNQYLFTDRDGELQIWDWQSSTPIDHPSIPEFRSFSRDGSVLVSSDKTGRYLIWDATQLLPSELNPFGVEPNGKQFVTLGQIKRNQLLQNFPNPFNPETWIPFRLANESDVTIRIYTSSGKLARFISLGKMSAGDYSSQSQAIHWDGRNDNGEAVSSGVYLYTINAGNFSATRKMLIRK